MPELVWNGKYRDGVRVEPSRSGCRLLTEELFGSGPAEWRNRLILGDCSRVLPTLVEQLGGKAALAYIDPPFDTGGSFVFRATIPDAPPDAPRLVIPAYRDAQGLDAWLAWLYEMAVHLRELLVDGGSLYVHLDAHAAHYAKVVLDEVFGKEAFQREIIWRIGWVSGFKSRARGWIRNHDTLLFYAKGGHIRTFHKEYIPYPPGYARRAGAGSPAKGYPVDDVWNGREADRMDSIQIVSFSGEKVGYPTQKNESLLSRIVKASSNPGDLVIDACAGSGTTAVVAERLGRRWIACDSAPIAIHTARKRLLSVPHVEPFEIERDAGVRHPKAGTLSVRVGVEGRRATVELRGFSLPRRDEAIPQGARETARHWSQWIEGWSVDWDHRGGPPKAGSADWRTSRRPKLSLSTSHTYERAGTYSALVRVFDLFGRSATRTARVKIEG